MRAAILVCLLASVAIAAPRYKRVTGLDPTLSDHVRAAEAAWSAAEQETDKAKQLQRWEAAAEAFALVDGDPVDARVKREAAYAAMLAWKNALDVDPRIKQPQRRDDDTTPRPLPDREQKLIAALDRYAMYAGPTDPERPSILYMKAATLRRFEQHEQAIPLFRSVIDTYPRHEVAAYAANLLLDTYNRLAQFDKLLALADELAANTAFLDGRDDLAHTVKMIRRQAKRKEAERLANTAKESKDFAAYDAAGRSYLAIYNGDVDAQDNDEILYNAGVMFEEGRSFGPALDAYARVRTYYPNSRLASRALARTGKLYGDMAFYDRAAEALEQYAKLYTGEADARDAMSDAIFFRTGIGHHAKAIANTEFFARTFGPRRPADAARWKFKLTAVYEAQGKPAAVIAHLRDYTRTWGHKGSPDDRVIAHAKLGQLLWKQSCSIAGVAGLCATSATRPQTCHKGTARTLTAVRRNAKLAKQALAELTTAVQLSEKHEVVDPQARHYQAFAKLTLADVELETFLAIGPPKNAGAFDDWLKEKLTALSTPTQLYSDALFARDPAATVAATERAALLAQSFAGALTTARWGDDLRCSTALRSEQEMVDGYKACLAHSSKLGWTEASTRCERALRELEPDAVPPLREVLGAALFDRSVIISERPLQTN